jgi:hypothetical protein
MTKGMEIEMEFGTDHAPIAHAVVRRAARDPMFCPRLGLQAPEKPATTGNAPWWRFDSVQVEPTTARYIYSFCNTGTGQSADWLVEPWAASGAPDFENANNATVSLLMIKARTVWNEIAGEFMDALRTGAVVACGRVGSPLGPIKPVPSDAWMNLEVSDWKRGSASVEDGGDGQPIYSLHILECVEDPPRLAEPSRKGRKDDLFREVLAILSELYPAGPPRTRSIKQLVREVAPEMVKRDSQAEQPSWATVRRARIALEASLGK